MPSPVGRLTLVASPAGLRAVLWETERPGRVPLGPMTDGAADPILLQAQDQIGAYFEGRLRAFDLPLDSIGTPFQKRVWSALEAIPFGEVRTYGAIAANMGDVKAVRAVGAANGRNPLSIVVPCHRVIGASGLLTGFAGGLEAKAALLAFEGVRIGHDAGRPERRPMAQGDLFG